MVHAFVMTRTSAGKSEGLLDRVADLDGVADAHIVAGDYDVIIELEVGEMYDVLNTVSADVQAVDGVTETKTYVSID